MYISQTVARYVYYLNLHVHVNLCNLVVCPPFLIVGKGTRVYPLRQVSCNEMYKFWGQVNTHLCTRAVDKGLGCTRSLCAGSVLVQWVWPV